MRRHRPAPQSLTRVVVLRQKTTRDDGIKMINSFEVIKSLGKGVRPLRTHARSVTYAHTR